MHLKLSSSSAPLCLLQKGHEFGIWGEKEKMRKSAHFNGEQE